jgi:Rab9 effector protein with kelch motifs
MKSKNPLFQSRCSHSLVSYKDQLIVFGGLKSAFDVLEDMMVLSLKDSEPILKGFNKEEIKNICKYC